MATPDKPKSPRDETFREKPNRERPWQPPSLLPDPNPRVGLHHRWVRKEVMGQEDRANVARRAREGYAPVPASEYTELAEFATPQGTIENGGQILCAIPSEVSDDRRKYFDEMNQRQVQAADHNFMHEARPSDKMPLLESKRDSETEFGQGRADR